MQTHVLSDESIKLLRILLAAHRDELEFVFQKSFSPEVVGIYGRPVDESDMRISHELEKTIELMELLDGGTVVNIVN